MFDIFPPCGLQQQQMNERVVMQGNDRALYETITTLGTRY